MHALPMFAASDGYERYMGRWSRRLAPAFLDFTQARDGARFLDVGTGTGALAATVATTLKDGEVIGVDASEAFIAGAQHAAPPRVQFRVADAQALPFPDAFFDHVAAALVINFIPDHDRALSEMRRVTRPEGKVSACVWDYGEGMESLRIFWDETVALFPALAPRHERNMKLCRQGELGNLWRKAGLTEVREDAIAIEQSFAGFADYWEPFLAGVGPGGACVASLAGPDRERLAQRLRGRLAPQERGGALKLKARAWCVRGTAPAR